MVMDRETLRSRGVALITAAQLASLLDSVPSEVEQQLDRTMGLLPHALDDMYASRFISARFITLKLLWHQKLIHNTAVKYHCPLQRLNMAKSSEEASPTVTISCVVGNAESHSIKRPYCRSSHSL